MSITKIGHRSKFKWLGDFEELKLFVDGYLKITGTWSYTTNNGGFHTMKAEGASISFYPGTKTLNVQGSKSQLSARSYYNLQIQVARNKAILQQQISKPISKVTMTTNNKKVLKNMRLCPRTRLPRT